MGIEYFFNFRQLNPATVTDEPSLHFTEEQCTAQVVSETLVGWNGRQSCLHLTIIV